MSRDKAPRPAFALVLLLFFCSGALALVYQVVWSRMMTHIFGSTAVAVGAVERQPAGPHLRPLRLLRVDPVTPRDKERRMRRAQALYGDPTAGGGY